MDLQKNVGRIESMLFQTCGCNKEEAKIVLETCLKDLKLSKKEKKEIAERRCQEYEEYLNKVYNKNT